MDLRKNERIAGITNIKIIDDKKSYPVTLTNISKTGISVKSQFVFPTFKEISTEMTINGKDFKIPGSIRWVNEHPHKSTPSLKEIGISLLNPPLEFIALIENL